MFKDLIRQKEHMVLPDLAQDLAQVSDTHGHFSLISMPLCMLPAMLFFSQACSPAHLAASMPSCVSSKSSLQTQPSLHGMPVCLAYTHKLSDCNAWKQLGYGAFKVSVHQCKVSKGLDSAMFGRWWWGLKQ